VANLPDYQDNYGGGFDLVPSAAFSNWGPHFTNPALQVAYSPSLQNAYPALYGAGKTQDYKAYNSVPSFSEPALLDYIYQRSRFRRQYNLNAIIPIWMTRVLQPN